MISLRRTGVAGAYRGVRQDAALTLRVDVGAADPLDIISGDLEIAEGGQTTFHHSFQTGTLVRVGPRER